MDQSCGARSQGTRASAARRLKWNTVEHPQAAVHLVFQCFLIFHNNFPVGPGRDIPSRRPGRRFKYGDMAVIRDSCAGVIPISRFLVLSWSKEEDRSMVKTGAILILRQAQDEDGQVPLAGAR
jgi:hypothetical protein